MTRHPFSNHSRPRIQYKTLAAFAWLLTGCLFLSSLSCAAQPAASAVSTDHLSSIQYAFYLIEQPRPVRIHVLTIDLSENKVEPAAVIAPKAADESCSAVRTDPRKLADHPLLQAFVNANPWTPWGPTYPINVQILGLAASQGVVRCSHRGVSVWTNRQGRVFIGEPNEADVWEGVGGFEQILKAAEVLAQPNGSIHPRTAVGINQNGDRLYFAAADGRQPGFSEGMNLYELACFMKDIGCWDAANMDGGGSTVLGIVNSSGKIQILNNPPGPLRPLPVILAIRLKSEQNKQGL